MKKKLMVALGLLSLAGGAFAAGKPCEELKSEIAAKLDGKGVSGYSLEIVDKGAAADGQKKSSAPVRAARKKSSIKK
nr:hypothetical protein GCM10020185_30900 [Pseudomonas brassicacearum subsp. brassicacearum]